MSTKFLLERALIQSIESVKPALLIQSALSCHHDIVSINDVSIPVNKNCFIVSFGKASYEMALETGKIMGDHLKAGIVSTPIGTVREHSTSNSKLKIYEGAANNLPDENSFYAARKVKKLVEMLNNDDILFVLISGGGSALLPYPKSPLTLNEKALTIKILATAGANITELNTVRKVLSELKGGKLAHFASPAIVVSLILSDVMGDSLSIIASGPTFLDNENLNQKALDILNKHSLMNKIPESVKTIMNEAHNQESCSQYDLRTLRIHNFIIGNNTRALIAAKNEIDSDEAHALILTNVVDGCTEQVAIVYSRIIDAVCELLKNNERKFHHALNSLMKEFHLINYIHEIYKTLLENIDVLKVLIEGPNKTLVLICGGETTVKVTGQGLGGRNQQLALEMALELKRRPDKYHFDITFLSAGTDGIDGPTDAAGAFVDGDIVETLSTNDMKSYLNKNDSYNFFKHFHDGKYHLRTGHTGTNVMDLHFIAIKNK